MIGLLLLFIAQPAAISPVGATLAENRPAITPAANARGIEIAQMLNSVEITRRQAVVLVDRDLPRQLAQDANFQELEISYPGVSKLAIEAMRPVILKHATARLPTLWARMGAIYAGAMTEDELATALAFYKSPTGIWLIEQVVLGSDFSDLMAKSLKDPDRKLTSTDIAAATTNKAMARVKDMMTPAYNWEILQFQASSAGRKIGGLQAKLAKAAADWSNEPNPAADKAMESAIGIVLDQLIAKSTDTARGNGPKKIEGPAA